MSKKGKNIAIGTLLGVGVGYLTGILTAKKSGKETRKDIVDTTIKLKNEAEKRIKQLNSDLSDILKKAEAQLSGAKSSAQAGLAKAIDVAKKAKSHIREVLSSIHEGDIDDEDLKKAIEEANSAIKHLKGFLDKLA